MKIIFTVLLILGLYLQVFSDNFKEKYKELSQQKDNDDVILQHLQKWKLAKPNDAELYVAYFNYYFTKSTKEIIRIDTEPGTGDNFEIEDSLGNTAGYLFGQNIYNDSLFKLAQYYVDEGIKYNPRRLDLYFGKIHTLNEYGKYDEYLSTLLNVINISIKNNFDWIWSDNQNLEDPKEFFIGTIQAYCNELFNLEPPKYGIIIKISEKMYSFLPERIEFLSNIGACYSMQEDYNKGLEYFLKANKINPKDVIVLFNLSYAYEKLNENDKAIKYLEDVIIYGNEEEIEYAKEKLEGLKKP